MAKHVIFILGFLFQTGYCQIPSFNTYTEFEKKYLSPASDTGYIFNFWATWCKPCVDELPYFTEAAEQYKNKPVKIIFVSLDSQKNQEKLADFVNKNLTNHAVVQLTDNKYNDWINRVDPSWAGSIPATLFVKGKKRAFHEKQFENFKDLDTLWLTFLKK